MVLGKLPKDLYEIFITNIKLNGYTSIKLAEFQTKISTYWFKHVQDRSSHLVMTLKQTSIKQEPFSENIAMDNLQNQIKDLTEIISNM